MKKLYVVALPVLMLGVLQLGGCTQQDIEAAPPGGVYASTSAGATFEQSVDIAGTPGEYIAQFSLGDAFRVPVNPDLVYIAAGDKGIVVSDNGGKSWQVVATPLTQTVDVVALGSGVLVASGVDGDGQGFVIRSLDAGKSWQIVLTIPVPVDVGSFQLFRGAAAEPSVVLSLALDPFNPERVYAGSNLGTVFVGEQSAKVWRSFHTLTAANQRQQAILQINPSVHQAGELYVVTASHALVRVRDGQQDVIKVPDLSGGPLVGAFAEKQVFTVAFIPGFPEALLVGVEDGVMVTRDGGATWLELPVPVEQAQEFNTIVVAVSPTNINRIFVAINSVLYRSEDGGATWNTVTLPALNLIITGVSINPQNASHVLLVTAPLRT